METTKGRKRVIFTVDAEPGSNVCISGTFNNWSENGKKLIDEDGTGHFSTTLLLHPGEYQYKFVMDGEWCVDPLCREWAPNDFGSINSVVRVG